MTAPNQSNPDGALNVGDFAALQSMTQEDAEASMTGGARSAVVNARGSHETNVDTPITERPKFTQTPIDFSMWSTMNPKEHCSIPRSQLIGGAASGTASANGDGSHSHDLSRSPDYKPDGGEVEVAFIRMQRNARIRYVGFATGDDATLLGISSAHIGVSTVNQTTGALTLQTATLSAADIKSQVTTELTEFIFDIGSTIVLAQNDIIAVQLIQNVSGLQSPANYLGARIKKTSRWNGTLFPYYQYCWTDAAAGGNIPSSTPAANLHWNNDPMTVPFVFVREE